MLSIVNIDDGDDDAGEEEADEVTAARREPGTTPACLSLSWCW
jgi:hypothetical protein